MQETTPPFVAYVGIRHTDEADIAAAEVEVGGNLANRSGNAHGGLIATLMDTTMGKAARRASNATSLVTVEMKVSYMAAGRGLLRCTGWCVHKTGTLVFCEAEIRDANNAIVARASATFKFRK